MGIMLQIEVRMPRIGDYGMLQPVRGDHVCCRLSYESFVVQGTRR